MLAETLSIWRRNFVFFVGYTLLIILTPTLLGGKAGGGSALGMFGAGQLYIGFLVQRAVIFDTPFLTRRAPEGGGRVQYFLKGLALGFMILVPALAAALIAGFALRGPFGTEDKPKFFLILAVIVICFVTVKTLLGTWLPASIKGDNNSLGDAFTRGVQGFVRLFFGMLGIGLANFVVTLIAAIIIGVVVYVAGVDIKHLDSISTTLLAGLFALVNLFFVSMVDVLFALEVRDEDGPASSLRQFQSDRFQKIIGKPGFSVPQISPPPVRHQNSRPQFGRR